MFRTLTFATALVAGLSFAASAKDTLYIVNSASAGGSYNAQSVAYAQGLEDVYKIEYIHAKGCTKSAQVINKILSNGGQVIALYGSSFKGDDCAKIAPTQDNFLYTNAKVGLIFSLKDAINDDVVAGSTMAFNANKEDEVIAPIESANGIDIKTVRYKNSKEVVLAVKNGETQFGVIESAKYFYRNVDIFEAHYNLSDDTFENIPSVVSIGGLPMYAHDTWLYHGSNIDSVRAEMNKVFNNPESAIAKWQSGIKGYSSTMNMSRLDGWNKYFN